MNGDLPYAVLLQSSTSDVHRLKINFVGEIRRKEGSVVVLVLAIRKPRILRELLGILTGKEKILTKEKKHCIPHRVTGITLSHTKIRHQ